MKVLFPFLFVSMTQISLGQSFPDRCVGIWEGTMHVYQNSKLVDSPKVTFKVAPIIKDSIWRWNTHYSSEKYGEISKDYKLVAKNAATGTYLLDEGQDLHLDAQVLNNKMYSSFEVAQSALHSTYILEDDQLYFEVITALKDGDTTAVKSYPVVNVQYVTLSRKLE